MDDKKIKYTYTVCFDCGPLGYEREYIRRIREKCFYYFMNIEGVYGYAFDAKVTISDTNKDNLIRVTKLVEEIILRFEGTKIL